MVAILIVVLGSLLMGCQSEIEKARKELDEAIKIGRGDPTVALKKGKSTEDLIFNLNVLTLRYIIEKESTIVHMQDYAFVTPEYERRLTKAEIYLPFFYVASQRLGNAYLKEGNFEEAKSIYLAPLEVFDQYFSDLSRSSLDASRANYAKNFSEFYLTLLDSLSKCYTGLSRSGDNPPEELSLIASKRERAIKRMKLYAEILPGLKEKEKERETMKKKKAELNILKK